MKHAKLLAFGLAAGLTLALGANALAAETKVDQFTDVQNHWAKESIQFVVENDLFNGVSETSFAPNSTMTRGMVTTVLYRLVGSPEVSGESVLDDVPDGLWYSDAVNWAVANNVARGIKTNMFQPNDPVTREDLASMMFGFAKL